MADHFEYTTTGKPHPYHLVSPSIWPLVGALVAGMFTFGMVLFMHKIDVSGIPAGRILAPLGFLGILTTMWFWWKDVIHEAVVEKAHSPIAKIGLRYGMTLFIASEVMFFVAFFWAFFSSALFPTEAIGYIWPPATIHPVAPFHLPFLMTMILLLSGCTVTWAHHAILEGHQKEAVKALGWTVFLGVAFLSFQIYEYTHAHFGFTDGIFASTFYMATGFHGFHVFVGTVFLFVCWFRTRAGHFTAESHFGFEAAAWYWHFVDVVWLFLFIAIYWWGGTAGINHVPAPVVAAPAAVSAGTQAGTTDAAATPATAPAAAQMETAAPAPEVEQTAPAASVPPIESLVPPLPAEAH
jgi:cytochrome c oxidase subunit 3